MQLAVIGPGTMGLMSATRLVETGRVDAASVRLSRVSDRREPGIRAALPGATLLNDNATAVAGADVVLLAVKPKHFADVAAGLRGRLEAGAIVISLMTAIDLAAMSGGLGVGKVVRASTNIGIQAGVATTYWATLPSLGDGDRTRLESMFGAWGDQFECGVEKLLDVAMVGVGSGPALVIEFALAMMEGMVANGMPRQLAERGILSLVSGTAALVRSGERSPAEFQRSVVTPGGITAEALVSMERDGFRDSVVRAFQAALDRTAQLTSPD